VVAQEGAPSLTWRSTPLGHVLGNARLRDLKPEFEQFAVDGRSRPISRRRFRDQAPPTQSTPLIYENFPVGSPKCPGSPLKIPGSTSQGISAKPLRRGFSDACKDSIKYRFPKFPVIFPDKREFAAVPIANLSGWQLIENHDFALPK
jgi:hypothetical protein